MDKPVYPGGTEWNVQGKKILLEPGPVVQYWRKEKLLQVGN